MVKLATWLNILVRLCGTGALGLGVAFWLGYARFLTRLHMTLGIGLVLSLWALAAIALKSRTRGGLIAFASVWGLVTWVFGMKQGQILTGPPHGIVEVAHLAVGIIAIALASRLAKAVTARRSA